ncbi:MAG: hypothetical protein ACOCTI_04960 [Phycisphaeraceae bacterium]
MSQDAAPARPWWTKTVRIYQPNNFEIDPQTTTGETIADECTRLDCNVIIVDAGGGIRTFYPTAIEELGPNPYLAPGQDFFGDMTAACKQRGIRVLARNDFGRMNVRTYEAHPDWALRSPDGATDQAYDAVATCPTSDLFLRISGDAFREQIENYDIDGIYINALGGRCWCERCRGLFEKETGHAAPTEADWNDPVWHAWIEFGYRVVDRLAKAQYEAVKAVDPGQLYFIDSAGYQEPGWITGRAQDLVTQAEHQDVASTESFNNRSAPYVRQLGGIVGRFIRRCGDRLGKPGWQFVSSFPGHAWPCSNQPPEEYEAWASAAYLSGCSVVTPFYGHLDEDDLRVVAPARRVYGFAREHKRLLNQAQPIVPVAVVWSRRTLDHYGQADPMGRYYHRFMAACRALLQEQIPFTVIPDEDLEAGRLDGIDTLVAPNLACVSDTGIDQLERFVAAGGAVVADYDSLGYDMHGRLRESDPIERFGIARDHTAARFPDDWHLARQHSYLLMQDLAHPLFAGFENVTVLPYRGSHLPSHYLGEAGPAPMTWAPPAQAQPPEMGWIRERTDTPMVLFGGGGRFVYFPFELFELAWRYNLPDHRRLIGNAVRMVTVLPVYASAPTSVELTLARAGNDLLIGLVNHTPSLLGTSELPVTDLEIALPGCEASEAVRLHESGGVETRQTGDGLQLRIDRLARFDLIRIPG